MKKIFLYCFMALQISVALPAISHAVTLESGEWKFGINGFLDGVYTWMDESPMMVMVTKDGACMSGTMSAGGTKMGRMCEMSTLDQSHMNLLFGAEKEKMRININLASTNSYEHDHHGSKGAFKIEEAYGVYNFSQYIRLQIGNMLTPFGLYNQIRYITPLFATVVLPQMYQMPGNYLMDEESIRTDFTPDNSNLMLFGDVGEDTLLLDYQLYLSGGYRETGEDGTDPNKNKGLGSRLRLTLLDEYKLGLSYYTVEDNKDVQGTMNSFGLDLELNFFEILKLEGEYAENDFEKRDNRFTYYVRLTAYLDNFSPFISYDFARDYADVIYKRGQARYSLGTGYSLSDTTTFKAEYHYHKYLNKGMDKDQGHGLLIGTDEVNMLRSSLIFIF